MPPQPSENNLFFIAVGITMSLLNAVYKNGDFSLLKVVHMTSPAWSNGKNFEFSSEEDQDLELNTLYAQCS